MKKRFLYLASICVFAIILLFSLSACECNHEWESATCTTPKTCRKCGETMGSTSLHDYERLGCEEYMRCTKCEGNSLTKSSHFYRGECEKIGTCSYCGEASPDILEHNWKGNVHTGVITCNSCYKSISETDIQGKTTSELTDVERAYIYWHLNHYLTALTSYGSYAYTTDEAFQMVAKKFYLSKSYLEQDFWGVNSTYNHKFYSKYYYK